MNNQQAQPPNISIIIPTLNEAQSINATLDAVQHLRGAVEVIIVDGGSLDRTCEIASERGIRLLTSGKGRGLQMHTGASAANGEILWFLHADTIVPADAAEKIIEAFREEQVVGGNFNVQFEGAQRAARFLTWLYPRLRRLGLCYGDSAIFVRREVYMKADGFKPFPIFEDVDLVRRLRRMGRVVHLHTTVITSSRRFQQHSFALTFLRWSILQLLYWLGVHPQTLGRLYAPIRSMRIGNRT